MMQKRGIASRLVSVPGGNPVVFGETCGCGRFTRCAVLTPMDLPISQEVIRVVESARGPTVKIPNMGGGLPLVSVERPTRTCGYRTCGTELNSWPLY
jgi:hypothetical protein